MLLLQFLNGREALAAGAEELGEMELGRGGGWVQMENSSGGWAPRGG